MNPIPLAVLLALAACGQQAPGAPQSNEPATAPAPSASPVVSATPTTGGPVLPSDRPIARTTSPAPAEPDDCGASKLGAWLNAQPTADVKASIASTSGARAIRYIGPGDAVTMDYSPARLNVETGEDGRIKRFRCG